ncbi:putative dNA polymerase subunit III (Alpha) dnaE2 [Mycobacterium xenopi 3993]|nr:putative dNA polymerase subunit III (Alpha) dnaE2 [Mycobacterium xenopi 3993]
MRQALSDGGPDAAAKALADLVDRFGSDRVSIELTHHGQPLDDERNVALAALAPRFKVSVVATTGAHFAAPSRPGWRWPWARSGPAIPGRGRRLAGPLGGSHLRSGRRWPAVRVVPEAVTAASGLPSSARSGWR